MEENYKSNTISTDFQLKNHFKFPNTKKLLRPNSN